MGEAPGRRTVSAKGKPEKAKRHEQLARVIEKIAKAACPTVPSPPIAPVS